MGSPLGGIGGIWERPEVTPEVAVEGSFVGFGSACRLGRVYSVVIIRLSDG